jgi:hypothetical protein
MTTIPIEVSTEQLLRAVERLPPQDLEAFVAQVIALRAQRSAPHLSPEETALLRHINASLAPDLQRHFDELIAKRQAETISPNELQELVQLTEQIEEQDAQRLAALGDLARLRKMTIPALMDLLGIRAPTYA